LARPGRHERGDDRERAVRRDPGDRRVGHFQRRRPPAADRPRALRDPADRRLPAPPARKLGAAADSMKFVLASFNPGKRREWEELMAGAALTLVDLTLVPGATAPEEN